MKVKLSWGCHNMRNCMEESGSRKIENHCKLINKLYTKVLKAPNINEKIGTRSAGQSQFICVYFMNVLKYDKLHK